MELSIYNIQGEDTGRKIALEGSVFGIEPNDHAIYLTAKQYRANQRQGTYKARERSEMSGFTRKLFRQKGTGGARRDDINSDISRGGAHVFGSRPCSYSFKLNKRLRQLACRSALTYKAQDNQAMVLNRLPFEAPRTKSFVSMAEALNADGQKTPYVVSQIEGTVALSTHDIPGVSITRAQDLNAYCVLDCHKVVFTEDTLAQINEMFQVGTQQQSIDVGIIIEPITSEEMTAITKDNQQRYAFLVAPTINKTEICNAVEKMYSIKVDGVNTCRYGGKRSGRYIKFGVITGRKPTFKRAFITLQDEDTIDFSSNV